LACLVWRHFLGGAIEQLADGRVLLHLGRCPAGPQQGVRLKIHIGLTQQPALQEDTYRQGDLLLLLGQSPLGTFVLFRHLSRPPRLHRLYQPHGHAEHAAHQGQQHDGRGQHRSPVPPQELLEAIARTRRPR
jgi:hypothetical protein